MILIIGGISSGKKTYVTTVLGYREDQIIDGSPADHKIAETLIDDKPVVYNLQDIIKNYPEIDEEQLVEQLLKKEVVICNEVGAGIIPVIPQERKWREQTGRICVLLAKEADKVIRLTCGIPIVIKGE